jgi:hypothetical protein
VPARVVTDGDRPVRVTTDRRGFAGGEVVHASGPWRTSGDWWADDDGRHAGPTGPTCLTRPTLLTRPTGVASSEWNRDEWDVALSDGGMYRVFHDRLLDRWFFDAIVD